MSKLVTHVLFLLVITGLSLSAQVPLISPGAVWKYLDNGVDQGTGWISPGFNDGSWSSGPAPLGYSDGDTVYATTNLYGADANNKYPTYYYRHTFDVPDASAITNLRASLLRDDGAAVYLNGTEVFRVNMPTGAVYFTNFASGTVSGTDETAYFPYNISAGLLVSGANLVAVEIHQVSATSTDISFDLGLEGNPLPTIAITSPTNGQVIANTNLVISGTATPGGPKISLVEVFAGAVKVGESTNANFSVYWQGAAPGSYSLTAKITDNLGLTAVSAPVSITVQQPPASTLIARGSSWKYLDTGVDQGTGWIAVGFDDSTWKSGLAELGYGDSDERTVVSYGTDANNKYITTYFRKAFTVSDPTLFLNLVMTLRYDDGAVIYLNSAELFRIGMPSGTIGYSTYASAAAEYSDDVRTLPKDLLLAGTNVIAVEMHQGNATSSDLSFDMELKGDLLPTVTLTSPTQGQSFTAPARITVSATASDEGGTITSVQFFDGPLLFAQLLNAPYSFVWSNVVDGAHVLTAVATDDTGNSVSTAPVNITVVDTSPPRLVSAAAVTNEVTVVFSKRVTAASANDPAHYIITNHNGSIPVLSATLNEAGNSVLLSTGPMTEGQTYTLIVNNIQSVDEQLIAPNSQIQFTIQQFVLVNIGSPPIAGSQVAAGGGLNVTGSGTNILGLSDQFVFSYVERLDDFDVEVRLDGLSMPNAWAKAGLMARESLAPNARFAASIATPSVAGSFFESRSTVGGSASVAGYFPVNYPNTWLRLRRTSATEFVGYASTDGRNWTELGRVTLTGAARPMLVGLAVTSASSSESGTGQFRNFNDATGDPTTGSAFAREPLGPSSRRSPFVISEIMYNPKKPLNYTGSLEWIELYSSQAWDEDIGNYRISGAIDYTFPAGTVIKSGGFLVVARDPGSVQTFYGISGVLGPWEGLVGEDASTNGLPNDGGLLRLRGRADEVLFEVNYLDRAPWPEAADGAGHSIVLARPSFGESDPRAWAASDIIGGSPGRFESLGAEPLREVVINEFLAHTDPPLTDFIELYNHSSQSVDISGAWLSDDPDTNKFRIPNNTILPARGYVAYDTNQLGFALSSGGERILLVNPSQTRVIDAIRFEGQANGVSTGRYPNGAPTWFELAARSPGQANTGPIIRDIVINEIMYNPISGNSVDEYVELHNKGESPVDVGGWQFSDGIDYRIPPNTIIPTNGFLVIAKSLTNMLAKYPQLNPQNTKGDYDGNLANGGERIALSRPDQTVGLNNQGLLETNTIYIVVDEVTYDDGDRWGWWADGGGGSLELKDPNSDNRLAANWADSDETQKAPWTVIQGSAAIGEALGTANDRLIIYNPGGIGECLIDDVEVVNFGGANSISANAGFESGAAGVTNLVPQGSSAPSTKWSLQGSHDHSLVSTQAFTGSYSLHLRAASRGDNGPNRIYSPTLSPVASGGADKPVTLRCKARWLRGWPEILMLMKGDTMEIGGKLNLPSNLGSPGLPNSQLVNNAGPAIWDVIHNPILPQAGNPVLVTARAFDPDGLTAFSLKYRNDTAGGGFTTVSMVDNGSAGDAVGGDGLYTGSIPGQNSGVTVAFYLEAIDSRGVTNTFPQDVFPKPGQDRVFPTDARTRELVIRWGDKIIPGSFANYRLWLTSANTARWRDRRPTLNNSVMDATFVYNNYRVIYNMKPQYAGSPWHRGQMTTGPDGANRVDFDIEFPGDDRFLGETDAVWNYPGNPGGDSTSDTSYQTEQTSYLMFKGLNLHYNYRRYVHIFVNGNQRSTISAFSGQNSIMEDSQQPNAVTVQEWSPDDTNGDLYKIEDEFWFPDDGQEFSGNDDADLGRRNIPGTTQLQIAAYRFAFRKRALGAGNSQLDYASFNDLVNVVSPASNPNSDPMENVAGFYGIADPEQWLRIFAIQHAVGNWDSYGYSRGKNAYTYKPASGKFQMWTWDIDFTMGVGGDGAGVNLFSTTDSRVTAMWNTPPTRRAYFRAWQDLIDGPWNSSYINPILDAKLAAMRANNIANDPNVVTTIKNFVVNARSALQSQLNTVAAPFAINGSTSITTSNNLIVLTGTAPVKVKDLVLNGTLYPLTWTDVKSWRFTFVASSGTNTYTLTGLDSQGNAVSNASQTLTVGFTGPAVDPVGTVVFNEIMYNPTAPNASFVEIFNRSPNASFDISGWRVNGLDFTFPSGSILLARQYLVLAKDLGALSRTYGGSVPVAGVFDGNLDLDGETLTLLKPGTNSQDFIEVDKVRYEAVPPWIMSANGNGSSLMLVDSEEDNSRASNWSDGLGWRYFRTTSTVGSLASRVILALRDAGDIYVDNIELVKASEPGGGPNIVQNGNFETGTLAPWTAIKNHSNTVVTSSEVYDGNYSLHIIATGPGSTGDYISQSFTTLDTTNLYTFSFYYLPVGPNGLKYRVGTGMINFTDGVNVNPIFATPGAENTAARSLPPYDPIWLNEVAPNNATGLADNQGQRDPWIELYNAGSNTVSLNGYSLANNYNSNLTQWAFPAGLSIAPRTFKIVWVDGEPGQTVGDELHASFRLNSSTGSVALVRIVDAMPQVTDYLNYNGLLTDQGYGDYPDGQPFKRVVFTTRTPGANNIGKPADMYINEWMADNASYIADPADRNFEDWFEIYNAGAEPVDLAGYFLTDNLNDKNQFQIPAGYSIQPRGFLLVWADNDTDQNTNTTQLHVNFALRAAGEAIGLYAPNGVTIDEVTFSNQSSNVSMGRLPDGSANLVSFVNSTPSPPTPGASNLMPGGNTAPVLDPIADYIITLGQSLSVPVTATDAEIPPQALSFSLLPGAPVGATVAATGSDTAQFNWTPIPTQAPSTNAITIVATDDGVPPLSDQESFTVTVLLPPQVAISVADGQVSLSFPTIPGKTYRVLYADTLATPINWQPLGPDQVATGTSLLIDDTIGAGTQRFYLVQQVD
jgi:hypothetical protein